MSAEAQPTWPQWSAATTSMRRAAAGRLGSWLRMYGIDKPAPWDMADDVCEAFLSAAPPPQSEGEES